MSDFGHSEDQPRLRVSRENVLHLQKINMPRRDSVGPEPRGRTRIGGTGRAVFTERLGGKNSVFMLELSTRTVP